MGQVAHDVVLVQQPWCLLAAGGAAVVEDEHLFHADEDRVPYRATEYPLVLTRCVPVAAPSRPVGAHPHQVLTIHVHKKKPLLLSHIHIFRKTSWS